MTPHTYLTPEEREYAKLCVHPIVDRLLSDLEHREEELDLTGFIARNAAKVYEQTLASQAETIALLQKTNEERMAHILRLEKMNKESGTAVVSQEEELHEKDETIARLEAERELTRRLFDLDNSPITVSKCCNGKATNCCPTGHDKTCECILCVWRKKAYDQAETIRRLREIGDRLLRQLQRDIARLESARMSVSETAYVIEAEARRFLAEPSTKPEK